MPFTASHAAAVLPFRRTRLPWPALVIGSFGPDFQYFLSASGHSRSWHYYPDVFTRCIPFTVFVYFFFMAFMRQPLGDLLPVAVHRRMCRPPSSTPKNLGEALLALVALVIGIATHVLWDALTHQRSWFWQHIATLHEVVHVGALPGVYGYEIAQGASSVIGLAILAVAFVLWYRRTPPQTPMMVHSATFRFLVWATVIVLPAMGAAWRGYRAEEKLQSLGELASFQLTFVITSISIFLWELVIYSALITLLNTRKRGS